MKFVKSFAAVFVAMICTFSMSFRASAKTIDLIEWNEYENLVMVAEEGVPSNSSLENAQLKVRHEEGNRMVMFIMLTFSKEIDGGSPAVRFSLNGGEEIFFNFDGETEYNEEEYYLEVVSESDSVSRVMFEVIFGVKDGIPEKKEMKFIFRDPDGIPSNTYTVNLSSEADSSPEEVPHEDRTQSKTDKNNKTQTEKTAKTKKSTVVALLVNDAQSVDVENEAKLVDRKVLFISAAAVVLTGLLITAGAHYLKRKKHKGDKG